MPTVGHSEAFWLWRPLRLYSAVAASLQATAATFGDGAASHYATREVVAREHDLEVVGDEGAHEAVGVANFVLRLVRLHHGEVSLRSQTKKILTYESTNV